MNPGKLNCRVTVQKLTQTEDGQGGFATGYSDRATVWAQIQAITARTRDQYEQITPEILHRITIRYRTDVAVTDRIQYGSRIFELIGPPINLNERNAYLRLECREVVA